MSNKINLRTGVLVLFVLIAAFSRLIPHPPNFTPIGGMALFGAAYFSRRHLSFIVPLVAMWLSDLVYNNLILPYQLPEYYTGFQLFGSFWVYGAIALIVFLGYYLLRNIKITNIALAALVGAIAFFLITNFGVWAAGMTYPKTGAGLIACYAAGIPFFGYTLLGNLFYSAVLFGAFELTRQKMPALQG